MAKARGDRLLQQVAAELSRPGLRGPFKSEDHFEDAVWGRLRNWAKRRWPSIPTEKILLTSHKNRGGRSQGEWDQFASRDKLADVIALGSRNRLDIVVRRNQTSIGIEVERLSMKGHMKNRSAATLVHGLGQVMLGLANRTGTIMIVHCGPAAARERRALRLVARKAVRGGLIRLVVAP